MRTDVHLTRRHRELIQGLLDGLANKEIAAQLGITENTVKTYFSKIADKIGISGRFAIAQWAREYRAEEFRIIPETRAFEYLRAAVTAIKLTPQQCEELRKILVLKSGYIPKDTGHEIEGAPVT